MHPVRTNAYPGAAGLGISGDVALNTVTDDTEASVSDAGTFTVAGNVNVNASDSTVIASIAGAISARTTASGGGVALAGSYGQNEITTTTKAYVSGATISGTGLYAEATNNEFIGNFTAGGAGAPASPAAGGVAVAGSVSVNEILPITEAYVSGANLTLDGNATIQAVDESEIWAIAGSASFGGSVGVGIAIGVNEIGSASNPALTEAYAANSTFTIDNGSLNVSAIDTNSGSDPRIVAATASTGAGSSDSIAGIAGMVAVNEIIGTTSAYLDDSTVRQGTGSSSAAGVAVTASNNSYIVSVGGAVGVAGVAGVGAAVGYNQIATTTTAYLDETDVTVGGAVADSAQSDATIVGATLGVAVSTKSGGGAGAGSATVNQITDTIDAHIAGDSNIQAAGPIGLSRLPTARRSSGSRAAWLGPRRVPPPSARPSLTT